MAKSTTKPTNGVKSKPVAKPKVEIKAALSQERVAESDIDDSSDDETSDSGAKAASSSTPSNKAAGAIDISSGGEASDDAESESDVSSTDPSSSSEDEDDEPEPVTKPTSDPKPVTAAAVAPQADAPQSDEPRIGFEAPFGYTKLEGLGGPVAVDLASLGDKELWHIEVPAGVSLADLTTVSANAIKDQASVLSHKGLEYSFTEPHQNLANIPEAIIHPDPSTKSYRSSTARISRSLRLLPKLSRESKVDTIPGYTADPDAQRPDTNFEPARTIRPDPKTLRMRYKPPGFGPGRPGNIGSDTSSDEDTPSTHPSFRVPGASTPASKKKRTAEQADDEPTPAKLTKEEREAKRARKAARAAKRAKQNA